MQPVIISATKQRFAGDNYYLCGQYFQRKGKRLHRAVWEYHHGPVPDGYHVHHADGDRSNNAPGNLVLMEGNEHLSHHMHDPERVQKSRESMLSRAQPAACAWHGSEAGRAWHSRLGRANWAKREERTYICDHCGEEYATKYVYPAASRHYCSSRCRARAGRRRLHAGTIS